MSAEREMTLDEWCAKLPSCHRTNKELAKLKAAITTPQPQGDASPVEMSPEFTDSARGALAWVLYHHQGGSSPVGQPIRFALGMGAHDPLPDWRISEAKRYAEWAGSKTSDFHTPQVSGGGEWERAEFEKAAVTVDMNLHHDSGGYEDEITEDAWKLWLARAALTTLQARPASVDGLREGNWRHPDGGRIVGWVIEPTDVERMGADAFCLPREVAEALENLRAREQARPDGDLYDTIFAAVKKGCPKCGGAHDNPERPVLNFRELEAIAGAVFAAVFPLVQARPDGGVKVPERCDHGRTMDEACDNYGCDREAHPAPAPDVARVPGFMDIDSDRVLIVDHHDWPCTPGFKNVWITAAQQKGATNGQE